MKTTIDLPEPLVRVMKLRAARDGRKLKDVAAEVLEAGLRTPPRRNQSKPYRQKLDAPLFAFEGSKARAPSLTVAELLELGQPLKQRRTQSVSANAS
jgi:plasmid stability protein